MEEIFLDKDSSGLRVEYLEMPTDKISWNILVSDFYGVSICDPQPSNVKNAFLFNLILHSYH